MQAGWVLPSIPGIGRSLDHAATARVVLIGEAKITRTVMSTTGRLYQQESEKERQGAEAQTTVSEIDHIALGGLKFNLELFLAVFRKA